MGEAEEPVGLWLAGAADKQDVVWIIAVVALAQSNEIKLPGIDINALCTGKAAFITGDAWADPAITRPSRT